MNKETRLERLRFAIHGVCAPFYCAGSHVPQKPITLKFKDDTKFVVQLAEERRNQVAKLQPLINRCQQATFGDKRQTRVDRSVRDAVQLKAEKGNLSVQNFDPRSAGLLETIERELLPPGSAPITAELYALNIYTDGGHFAPHKDTPRGEDMFGTLVVCLPSYFWRGQLTLTHRGVVQQFDWGNTIEKQKQANQIHWAAFFGDVDHQIDRVGIGARVTLTYLLRRDAATQPSPTMTNEDLAPVIQEAWKTLLADASFMPKGGTIGYPCCHLYHQDARFQVEQKPLDENAATFLKGRDQLVAATALQAGLGVTFAPYLFETCIDETWQLDRFPTGTEKKKLKRRMELSDLESTLPIVGQSSGKAGDFGVVWLEDPPCARTSERQSSSSEVNEDLPAAGRLHSCEYCEWGYFGNEASDVDFYIYASLHVRIPSLGEGPRADLGPASPEKRKTTEASGTKRPVKKKAATKNASNAAPEEKAKPSKKSVSRKPKQNPKK